MGCGPSSSSGVNGLGDVLLSGAAVDCSLVEVVLGCGGGWSMSISSTSFPSPSDWTIDTLTCISGVEESGSLSVPLTGRLVVIAAQIGSHLIIRTWIHRSFGGLWCFVVRRVDWLLRLISVFCEDLADGLTDASSQVRVRY